MARVAINTGASANDGTGDNLRAAGGILNNNFLELYTYLGAGSTTVLSAPLWSSTNVGINTLINVGIGTTNPRFALEVGAVGASGTTLFVNGDARVTGIVTIGPASITLNGITNIINVGTGITINGSTGIISATAIVLGGTTLTGAAVTFITAGSGISVNQSTGNVTITATGGGSSQFVTTAAGIHTLSNVGIGTTNPTSALTVTGNGTFTGVVTATTFVGVLTGTATTATNAQGLTGTPNITVGVVTASTLNVGTGGTVITTTTAGLVGIGTTNPTSKLTVSGDVLVSDKIVAGLTSSIIPFYWENFSDLPSFSTYHGAFAHVHQTGKAYYAHTRWVELVHTEASGVVGTGTERYNVGIVTASSLNVSGVSTLTTTDFTGHVQLKANSGNSSLYIFDDNGIYAGTGSDLRIWHNSSDSISRITEDGGQLIIDANPITINHGGNTKLQTIGSGITVTGTTVTNQLSVSGISTLGTLQISSGIITATSGIVTYYGDASYTASGRWTLGANGSADYTFTGIGFTQTTNDPVLYLARGRVYEFVNNSGGSHPFQIRVSDGGSAYSNGVTNNGGASGVIRFEIPFSAPNTLYYQCTAHSGMGNTISVYPNTI